MSGKRAIIGDDEWVYRRVPAIYLPDPRRYSFPQIECFRPRQGESDGLSVDRASLTTIARSARGANPDRRYHLLRLSVRQLRGQELDVVADPLPDNPAHALIPQINAIAYKADKKRIQQIQNMLVSKFSQLVLVALDAETYPGPFLDGEWAD